MWKYLKRYLPFALLAVLTMFADAGADLVQPLLMAHIVDDGILSAEGLANGGLETILRTGLLMIAVAIIGGVGGSLCNLFTHLAAQNTGNLIRKDCFARIMRLSLAQADSLGAGTLITRMTNDVAQVQGLLSMIMRNMVRMLLFVIGSIALLFGLDSRFGLIALVACPLMALVIISCLRRTSPLFDRLQARIDTINAIMQEDLTGLRTVKAFVREAHEKIRFGKANDQLVETQLSTLLVFALMNPSVSAIAYLAIACLLAVGNHDVAAGATTPGDVMAALSYALLLLQGTTMIVLLSQNISRGLVSWKRLREILALEPEQANGLARRGIAGAPAIELRKVSFTYPGSRHAALSDVSLAIQPGETVALMGPTGCGKTTLANLIPRFYDACEGSVLVEGIDVREWDAAALRRTVAFALQKAELFNASVHENIAWGNPTASRDHVAEAARTAQAESFISKLPRTFDEPIAERGASLSGGQRQRIALARIALAQANIIILDDATSALDLKTEASLHAALTAANPRATKLIVAQRIASALTADRIAVMDGGRIVDIGPHDELMGRCALYRTIYESQIDDEGVRHG